jgi:hypothetical protein
MIFKKDSTDKLKQEAINGKFIAYKLLKKFRNRLYSIYYEIPYKMGYTNASDYLMDAATYDNERLYYGIHVYLNISDAIAQKDYLTATVLGVYKTDKDNYNYVVVAVECDIAHLLGAGYHEDDGSANAVLNKVCLSEEEYNKAFA